MPTELQNLSQSEILALALKGLEADKLQQKNQEKLELRNQYLETENLRLQTRVQQLSRILYGQKRERFENPDQPKLPFAEEPEKVEERQKDTIEKITYERKKPVKHPGRQPLPEHLPVEEVFLEPKEDVSGMVQIGQEVTDILEYKPASFYIIRYIRPKYARKDQEGVAMGKLPERTFDKCMAGNGLLTSIIVDKYVDHLPLYRQVERFKREKIPISPSTVDGWVKQVGGLLEILYDHLLKQTRHKGYLQADETPIKVLDRDKKGSCHLGYFWVYRSPVDKAVLFHYQTGRSARAAREILDGFKGYLQTDGYQVYDSIAKSKDIIHLNCWAHARREFDKALSNDEKRASTALGFIQSLYKVEADARQTELSTDQRKELRLEKSLPLLNAFGKWMVEELQSGEVLPKSAIGKAIAYTIGRWDNLNAYLNDGMLEIDNNLIENTIRPVALGRKNYLFAGSHEGAKRAAIIYSFFAMCKIEKVNPAHWLKHVLDNIQNIKISNLDSLYPCNFKELSNM
jgi:transposase